MAILRNGIIGDISGTLGEYVFRRRYGESYLSQKTKSKKTSTSIEADVQRSKFSFTVQFAKRIISVHELYSTWKSTKIKGVNGYQRIIKHNVKLTSDSGLTLNNIITPPGFEVTPDSITIEKSKLIIRALPDKPIPDLPFSFVTLLCVNNEKGSEHLLLQSDNVSLKVGSALEGIISLTPDEMEKITLCNKALLLSAFISSSPKLIWSSTIPFEIVTNS
jgi:hypothetical protein